MSTGGGTIALPKGGGALRGVGESFAPDPHTGTGNVTVPLALPTGRGGLQPALALGYSTGRGNGICGLGWAITTPGVARKTSTGVPRYDERDTFILAGGEDLVPVATHGAATRYRPRTEGLFAEITRHRDAADDYWIVRSPDGLTSIYGTPGALGDDPAVIADPARRRNVLAWEITATIDPFGNRVEYDYRRDAGEDDGRRWDALLLERIRYVDHVASPGGARRFLVSVTLDYGAAHEERPDPFSEYRGGFEVRTRRRCRRIVIRTHADVDRLVRSYELRYVDERVADGELPRSALPPNGVSLLSQIRVVGHDGAETEPMPPLELRYTSFAPATRRFFPLAGAFPARSLADPQLQLTGLFANGLPDVLEMNGVVRYWRNRGGGRFDPPREMATAPAGFRLGQRGVQLVDADGDGRTDLLVSTPTVAGYFPLRPSGGWDHRVFRRYRQAPSFALEDPEVHLVDLDGDGVTDAVRSDVRFEYFLNDPHEGWHETLRAERGALADFPNVTFSDPRVRWADMSGDGLQDIALVHDGNVEYWPNLGRGRWGRRVRMRRPPALPSRYDPRRVLLEDVDGDGAADLVYVDDGRVLLWMNRSGESWSDPIEIRGTPSLTDADDVRVVDLLGSGIGGVLWTRDANGTGAEHAFFLDFTGGRKPYLLAEMDNQMGAVTRIDYAPSTRFYEEDQVRRATRWKTTLPFPVQVVTRVETIDAIGGGKLVTEYRYRHGYWDGADREFRGFGMVETLDTESFDAYHAPAPAGAGGAIQAVERRHFSPPICTRTWYHQGPVGEEDGEWAELDYSDEYWAGDPPLLDHVGGVNDFLASIPQSPRSRRIRRDALRALRGSVLRIERYARDGSPHEARPYSVTETAYALREESPPPAGTDRPRVFFAHARASRTTTWERGDDPLTRVSFTDDVDPFGQPRRTTEVALPRRSARRHAVTGAGIGAVLPDETHVLATHGRSAYATPDEGTYLHDRVAQIWGYELRHPPEVPESAPADVAAVLRDGFTVAQAVHRAFLDGGPAEVRLVAHTVTRYDGPGFVGLPVGRAGRFGAATRSMTLVVTDVELDAGLGERRPEYFGGTAPLPAGAPAGFGGALGYEVVSGDDGIRRYYAVAEQRMFDFQASGVPPLGLTVAMRDELGNETRVAFDAYHLLPTRVTDPLGLTTSATYDYRLLQTATLTDANGNVSAYRYSPLGLLTETWAHGDPARVEGDRAAPSVKMQADFFAFARDGQPACIRTVRRLYHDTDAAVPAQHRDATVETREYSDGTGRLVQVRTQAEDLAFGADGESVGISVEPGTATGPAIGSRVGDRVIVSGWEVRDNKGQVVRSYEPFFDRGWEYRPDAVRGLPTTTFYDPAGRAVRIVAPHGAERRTVPGIPHDLADPDDYAPTPWERYEYDANDLAPLSRAPDGSSLLASAPPAHHFTPVSVVLDAHGHTLCRTERNGPDPATDWHVTRASYGLLDELLSLVDPLGREAFSAVYDLGGGALRLTSIDAGTRTSVVNAAGQLVEYRDARGSVVLREYDAGGRPTALWARDGAAGALTLRERTEYGDSLDRDVNRTLNRLGQPARHFDEAGLAEFHHYDHRGNLLAQSRRTVRDALVTDGSVVDWSVADPDGVLEARAYRTDVRLDAVDRVQELRYPADAAGHRARLTSHYDRAGELSRVDLDDVPFVTRISYDARGRRVLVAYGNALVTRYAYDPSSARLARMHTGKATSADGMTFTPAGGVLVDTGYDYDLVGNVVAIHDRAPGSGIPAEPAGGDALDRVFAYDALYRLVRATGRECGPPPSASPWADTPRCTDYGGTRHYEETYEYDRAGNLSRLTHTDRSANGSLRRTTHRMALVAGTNRLQSLTQGSLTVGYAHDDDGNLTSEGDARHLAWDHADRLRAFRVQAGTGPASVRARYLCDSFGARVKKVVRRGAVEDVSIFIDGIFEHHRRGATEHVCLHVMEDARRVAVVRVGPAFPDDGAAAVPVQYHLHDHLESCHLVVGGATATAATTVRREEYTPYGTTCFGSFARKRYRFMGKERDEESGLYYFGARYYAPWTARWASCDPAGIVDDLNLYVFAAANPITFRDDDGAESVKIHKPAKKDASGNIIEAGYLKTVQVRNPAMRAAPEGTRAAPTTPNPSPGGNPGGTDGESRTGVKDGGANAGGVKGGTGDTPGGTGDGSGGASGDNLGAPDGGPGGGESGSVTGSPTGSATSNGGSPNGTDDPSLHKKSSGEGGTGITGRGTGSLTQMDLAVLIANAVSDPAQAALDAARGDDDGTGKSGGVPEGGAEDAEGSEVVQGVYLAAKAVKAVVSAAVSAVSAGAKSGAQGIAAGTGKGYSVLAEVVLKRPSRIRFAPKWMPNKVWHALQRRTQSRAAWKALGDKMNAERWSPALRQQLRQMQKSGDWVWHHHCGRVGVMQLVPRVHHQKWYSVLHPRQMGKARGGYWKWGHLYWQ